MIVEIKRLENAHTWLTELFSEADEFKAQNIGVLITKMNMLCNALPFVNNQMAVAKKLLNEKRLRLTTGLKFHLKQTANILARRLQKIISGRFAIMNSTLLILPNAVRGLLLI